MKILILNMQQIEYKPYNDSDFEPLLKMCQQLWTDFEETELTSLIAQLNNISIIIARASKGEYVGFSIFTLRCDYVEGAERSPTGYLEGIFVYPPYRKQKIAKEFIRLGEIWCKERGCTQIGSDTWLSNKISREFHKKVGFREEEELVHFLKNIT